MESDTRTIPAERAASCSQKQTQTQQYLYLEYNDTGTFIRVVLPRNRAGLVAYTVRRVNWRIDDGS